MPGTIMAAIGSLGVYAIQVSHSLRQVTLHRFNQKMIMIRHQAESMANPIVSFNRFRQHVQKGLAILIILVNRSAPVTPGSDVIKGTGKLYT